MPDTVELIQKGKCLQATYLILLFEKIWSVMTKVGVILIVFHRSICFKLGVRTNMQFKANTSIGHELLGHPPLSHDWIFQMLYFRETGVLPIEFFTKTQNWQHWHFVNSEVVGSNLIWIRPKILFLVFLLENSSLPSLPFSSSLW